MKKQNTSHFYAAILALLFFAALFSLSFVERKEAIAPERQVKVIFTRDLQQFETACQVLETACSKLDAHNIGAAKASLAAARRAYKRVEWLASYFESEYTHDYLNGPPLPRPERHAPTPNILAPEGLQTIETLLYEPNPDTKQIVFLARQLTHRFKKLNLQLVSIEFSDTEILAACRYAVFRSFALGLAGFDTPESGHQLSETKVIYKGLQEVLSCYYESLQKQDKIITKILEKEFENAQKHLNDSDDSDAFDRLKFLMEVVNPLYSSILDVQLALEIETERENSHFSQALRPEARNLFAPDLLDTNWFLGFVSTTEQVELGRELFYEPALSANNTLSCSSCHQPERAFTDGLAKGQGEELQLLQRNSPTLINAVYTTRYFHDLRAERLTDLIDHVVVNDKEFDTNYMEIGQRLAALPEYQAQFARAFPNQGLSKHAIVSALAAYVASISSFNSPFDRYLRRESNALTTDAKVGFNVFMGKGGCGSCHFVPVFNGLVPPYFRETESEIIGTPDRPGRDLAQLDPDPGRAGVRENERLPLFLHSFRTPTVRNIALTAPYMHNGVFETLEEVIDFYDEGGGQGWGLPVPNQTLPASPLNLSPEEKRTLIVFLKSLTDTSCAHLHR